MFAVLIQVVTFVIVLLNVKVLKIKKTLLLLIYLIIPTVFLIIDTKYNTCIGYVAVAISYYIVYIGIDLNQENNLIKNESIIEQKDEELGEKRLEILIYQIKPKFIFNTLASIEQLYEMAPEKAGDALSKYTRNLRLTVDELDKTKEVGFEKEMQQVRMLVWFEKMKYDEKIVFVENAIKYGMDKASDKPLTIVLRTSETDENIKITITDDGKGFDMEEIANLDKDHIGINNVSERLKIMADAKFEIFSRKNEGTKITITIPKKIKVNI